MYVQDVIEKLLDMAVDKTSSLRGKQAVSFTRNLLVKPVGELVADVNEKGEEVVSKVDKTIESVLNMELENSAGDATRSSIEELLREKNLLKEATCETGDFMCPVDRSVMISSIVLDKVMIWSRLVDAFEAPMASLLEGISHAVFRDEDGSTSRSEKKWHGSRCREKQKRDQIVLLKVSIDEIKDAFNLKFDDLMARKEAAFDTIVRDKNKRIVEILNAHSNT